MSEVFDLKPVASDNSGNPPEGAPEGMSFSLVNDTIREVMAKIARFSALCDIVELRKTSVANNNYTAYVGNNTLNLFPRGSQDKVGWTLFFRIAEGDVNRVSRGGGSVYINFNLAGQPIRCQVQTRTAGQSISGSPGFLEEEVIYEMLFIGNATIDVNGDFPTLMIVGYTNKDISNLIAQETNANLAALRAADVALGGRIDALTNNVNAGQAADLRARNALQARIATLEGRDVVVNPDWDAVAGRAQILNKPGKPFTVKKLVDIRQSNRTTSLIDNENKNNWDIFSMLHATRVHRTEYYAATFPKEFWIAGRRVSGVDGVYLTLVSDTQVRHSQTNDRVLLYGYRFDYT